jgi:predicted DNA-binding transcriptional regulator AlpA
MATSKRLTIAKAKALAAQWEHQFAQCEYDCAIAARFRDATPTEVIAMWESGTNDKGQRLSQFEFAALCERWIEIFNDLPPDNDTGDDATDFPTQPLPCPEVEPLQPDTLVSIKEVSRRTGISASTIKRMVLDGRFPKPCVQASAASHGWGATSMNWCASSTIRGVRLDSN